MKKKLLIIGSSGFLGSNCLKYYLKKKNYKIYTLTKSKQNYPKEITQIISNLKSKKLKEKLNNYSFNYVINTALYVNHEAQHEKGLNILNYNFECIKNLIRSLNRNRLEKFIHIGSADEYRNTFKIINENNTCEPKNYYSLSKILITNYLILLNRLERFPVIILRTFLVYGEYQKTNRLIPYIINNGLKKNNINLSSGSIIRDFLYVEDFLTAINKSMKTKINGEIINICYGKSFSIFNIINIIKKDIKNLNIFFNKHDRYYELANSVKSSNKKALKILKWSPKISIKVGIKKTIKYYKEIDEKNKNKRINYDL